MAEQILITERDAGRLLCILPTRLKRMAKRNEVLHVLLPDGEIRFCAADLAEWAAGFKVLPNHATASGRAIDADAAAESGPPPSKGARRRARG